MSKLKWIFICLIVLIACSNKSRIVARFVDSNIGVIEISTQKAKFASTRCDLMMVVDKGDKKNTFYLTNIAIDVDYDMVISSVVFNNSRHSITVTYTASSYSLSGRSFDEFDVGNGQLIAGR